jgi:hypothetical protein
MGPAIVVLVLAGPAAGGPLTAISRCDSGASWVSFTYGGEEIRPRASFDKYSRAALDGTIRLAAPAGAGFLVRARAAGPWEGETGGWFMTDLDLVPSWEARNRWGRVDLEVWLTLAAPAGVAPARDPWYRGLRKWSYGPGFNVSARAAGSEPGTSIWLGFGLEYRSQGRSGWVYLPRHSVAIADSSGEIGGSVVTWEGRLEIRGERATLATAVVQENLIDAGALLSKTEEPLYLVQSAYVRAWRGLAVTAVGEVLLSGDAAGTDFSVRSVLPSWTATVGLSWEYPLWGALGGSH